MKFVLVSPKNRTIYNFRGDLLEEVMGKGYSVTATGPDKTDIDKVLDLGISFKEIPLKKTGTNIADDIKYYRSLLKYFKSEKPDVVLGYTIKPVIYGSIAAKRAGVKNINAMLTGLGYTFAASSLKAGILRFLTTTLYKISLNAVDNVIFQNCDDMELFIKKNLVKREKCKVVNGSGVCMERYPKTDIPDNITFFMLSRVLYSKGICEYLKAVEILKEKYPHVRFMLLGKIDETMQDSLREAEVMQYVEKGVIDYYGETDRVTDYYKQCSVFVLPSYREGTPRAALEAMSMGRPVITTDAPGCRETVIDGKTGFLIPVKNVQALADKMEWFIKNSNMIKPMGDAAYVYCKEKFEISKVNKSMLQYMNIN